MYQKIGNQNTNNMTTNLSTVTAMGDSVDPYQLQMTSMAVIVFCVRFHKNDMQNSKIWYT